MNRKQIAGLLAAAILLGAAACSSGTTAAAPPPASSASASATATDPAGNTCATLDAAGYCPGNDPATATDPAGNTCATLDAAGYCPGNDPATATDPAGNTCATLDAAGYCPGNDPAPTAPAMSAAEQQAITSAQDYLNLGSGFSYQSLLNQLTSGYGSGFSTSDAEFAINYLKPDWDAQAVEAAQGYLKLGTGFSRSSLIQQLTSSYGNGFTEAQAEYAVSKVGL
jgi:hypothetical protein